MYIYNITSLGIREMHKLECEVVLITLFPDLIVVNVKGERHHRKN